MFPVSSIRFLRQARRRRFSGFPVGPPLYWRYAVTGRVEVYQQ